jgi:RNA polymerase sigma factor (sigma-70 family)
MPVDERQPAAPIELGAHPRSDDDALVRRMQTGDEQAFARIFKRHHAPLLSYCRHMLGNQDEGEDALQQAFIKAHQALLGGTTPRELRPWLYAIARNCCLSAIAARRPTAPLQEHTPALEGLSEQVYQREDLRELVAAIGSLPEDQRSALLLAELDDLSHQAIATILGCPVRRVKALIYQARSTLLADRNARNASCLDIREQLSVAHGGELRRGPLRRHLNLCVGCRDFQLAVAAQRQSLAVVLPVLPSASLIAAILGHGAAHGAGAASVGGAGAGLAHAGGTAGTSVGVTTGGGTGIAATGTAAGTTVGASAGAGAGGGTSVGALVGGGLVTKLAIGGTIVALAAAGAVTVHHRLAHAVLRQVPRLQVDLRSVVPVGAVGRRSVASYVAANGSSSSLGQGSSAGLVLVSATGPAAPAGSDPGPPSTELAALGGAEPLATESLATVDGTGLPSLLSPSTPGQPAGKGDPGENNRARQRIARAKRRRAALNRRQLRRARLHRKLTARHRKALNHRRLPKPKPPKPTEPPKLPLAPTPIRVRHRKASPTPPPATVSPSAETTTGSISPETGKPHRPKPQGNGTGTGTGKPGSGKAGAGEASGTGTTGSTSGTGAAGEPGSTAPGTGAAGEPGSTAPGTSETTGAGKTTGPTPKAHPKKHPALEEQLPNL